VQCNDIVGIKYRIYTVETYKKQQTLRAIVVTVNLIIEFKPSPDKLSFVMFVSTRTMSLLFTVSMIVLCTFVSSFQPIVNQGLYYNHPVHSLTTTATTSTTSVRTNTVLNVYGNKKSKKVSAEEAEKYWQGEWVCKDCGYIYNRVRPFFVLFVDFFFFLFFCFCIIF
jgi:hypothetical protein